MSREEIQSLISTNEVEKLMLNVRGQNVLLDRDVAMLYDVETNRVNESVRNNPEKFPKSHILNWMKRNLFSKIKNFDLRKKRGKRSSF